MQIIQHVKLCQQRTLSGYIKIKTLPSLKSEIWPIWALSYIVVFAFSFNSDGMVV